MHELVAGRFSILFPSPNRSTPFLYRLPAPKVQFLRQGCADQAGFGIHRPRAAGLPVGKDLRRTGHEWIGVFEQHMVVKPSAHQWDGSACQTSLRGQPWRESEDVVAPEYLLETRQVGFVRRLILIRDN